MVWIISQVMLKLVSRDTFVPGINQHCMINTEFRISRKIADEQVTIRKGGIVTGVSSLLIFAAVLEKHSAIAWPKISYEPAADILLKHLRAGFAHFPQTCVAWKNDSLIFRQRSSPSLSSRNRANAGGQSFVIQRGASRIETGELAELHRGARHDKTAAGIFVGRIIACRFCTQKGNPILILEHGGVLKRQGVAIKAKIRSSYARLHRGDSSDGTEPANSRRFTPNPKHHIKKEPRR